MTPAARPHKLCFEMPQVFLRDGRLWVGGRAVPLLAGEMHYWRVPPSCWRACLEALKRLGLEVVSTYVPWQFHETAPRAYDFDGTTDPARDLGGFLRLCREVGLCVFVRPGPFIYAEWRNAGVPDRVALLHRLSDAYREEAAHWMAAVVARLKPHFATNGGPIVLFQADNEIDLFSHWFEEELGMGPGGGGAWQQIVGDAPVFAEPAGPTLEERRAALDYWKFQHEATARALAWHVELYRSLGVDLPIVGNYYPGGDVQNWRAIAKTVDLQGIDWYPRAEFGRRPEEHREFLDSCRLQSLYSPIPFVAEFECGVWHGYHEHVGLLPPNHYRLMAVSAMMAGITAWNWYMAVGRDNWYFSAVNERGEPRPGVANPIAAVNRLARELDLPALRRVCSTGAAFDVAQIGSDGLLRDNPVLQALYEADLDYVFVDPTEPLPGLPLVFYAAGDWLPEAAQRNLLAYAEAGGTLVVFQRGPALDEQMRPCNALGLQRPSRVLSRLGKKVELEFGGIAEGAVWVWDEPPGEPIAGTQCAGRQQAVENADVWMANAVGKRWTCGYARRIGRGRLVHLGLAPSASVAAALHDWLGVPIASRAALPGVSTALFDSPRGRVLMAANMNPCALECPVAVHGRPEPVAVRLEAFSGECFVLKG